MHKYLDIYVIRNFCILHLHVLISEILLPLECFAGGCSLLESTELH